MVGGTVLRAACAFDNLLLPFRHTQLSASPDVLNKDTSVGLGSHCLFSKELTPIPTCSLRMPLPQSSKGGARAAETTSLPSAA